MTLITPTADEPTTDDTPTTGERAGRPPARPDRRRPDGVGGDDRGVSEVLGTILMFAVLLALLVLIQATAVPGWNQQVEYEHNLRVQEDVQELASSIDAAVDSGNDRTVVVEMGAHYPTRPFLFNPPPPQGTLESVPGDSPGAGELRVENVTVGGTANYPAGNAITSTTHALRYRPGYNEYANAPTTVYENGLAYNRFPSGTVLPVDDSELVEGRNINLVAVDGRISRTSGRSASVAITPTSAPSETVTVSNASGDLTVRTPTLLNETEWERLLEDQLDGGAVGTDDDPDAYIADLRVEPVPGQDFDQLVLVMEPGTYSLRMAEVGIGDGATEEPAYYVGKVSGGGETVLSGTTTTLTAVVRDKYNNPVADEEVTVERSGGGQFVDEDGDALGAGPITATTNAAGRVDVRFQPANGTSVVSVTGDFEGAGGTVEPRERVEFTVTGVASSGSAGGGDTVSSINPGAGAGQVRLESVSGSGDDVTMTFNNDDPTTSLTMTQMRISYYLSDDNTAVPTSGVFSYGGNSETLYVYDDFKSVPGPTFGPDGTGTEQRSININDLKNNVKGDFMIVSAVYEDGSGNVRRITYFVGIV